MDNEVAMSNDWRIIISGASRLQCEMKILRIDSISITEINDVANGWRAHSSSGVDFWSLVRGRWHAGEGGEYVWICTIFLFIVMR